MNVDDRRTFRQPRPHLHRAPGRVTARAVYATDIHPVWQRTGGPAGTAVNRTMADRVTLADIARAAEVSVATVSRALKGGRVQVGTRARIQALADEMGYQPDPALSALSSYRDAQRRCAQALSIGLVVGAPYRAETLASSFHRRAHLQGVSDELGRLGYQALPILTVDGPAELDDWLRQRRVHGVVLAGVPPAVFEAAGLARVPVACIGNQRDDARFHRVDSDCQQGMRLVFDHALAAGYRRIALLMHPHTDDSSGGRWYAGFLHQQYRRAADGLVAIPIQRAHGRGALADLLEQWRPDCLVIRRSHRSEVAACGRQIPRDLGYISLGVQEAGHRTTGLVSNAREVGQAAARLVDAGLRHHEPGRPELPQTVMLPYRWNPGSSCRQLGEA